jgi:DNA-binding protein HU-beta
LKTKKAQKTPLSMTKAEVINEIVNKTGIGKAEVQQTVETFFKVMKTSMVEGKNVYFRGFGSFVLKKRAKKVARNISKNTAIVIDEHYVPKFKPAKTFVEKVKKSEAVKSLLPED